MSSTWEIMAITLLIGGAVAYLGRRVWKKFASGESASGCGSGCGSCAHNSLSTESPAVISLDVLTSSADTLASSRNL